MKKQILLLLAAMLIAMALPALAEIDLTGIKQVDGRLVGEVMLGDLSPIPLMIDCPVPIGFTDAQSQKITVDYQSITAKDLKRLLESLGYDVAQGTFNDFISEPERHVSYSKSGSLYHEPFFFWTPLEMTQPLTEQPLIDAKKRLTAIIEALDGTVYGELMQLSHYGEDEYYKYSDTSSSVADKLKALSLKSFRKNSDKDGYTDDDLTVAYGVYEVNGLPMAYQFRYPIGRGEWAGAVSSFSATFKDDGTIINLIIDGLPQVISTQPIALPERSWEGLLKLWIENCYWPFATEEMTYTDKVFGEVTQCALYDVLTELKPCYVAYEANTWEPGYYGVTETRVKKDDSVEYVHASYADAETFQKGAE